MIVATRSATATKSKGWTYTITMPNGRVFRRNSHREYTHAVISHRFEGDVYALYGMAGSRTLAEKAAGIFAEYKSTCEHFIVEVAVTNVTL